MREGELWEKIRENEVGRMREGEGRKGNEEGRMRKPKERGNEGEKMREGK